LDLVAAAGLGAAVSLTSEVRLSPKVGTKALRAALAAIITIGPNDKRKLPEAGASGSQLSLVAGRVTANLRGHKRRHGPARRAGLSG
jgi:hypothetical protein